jgi:hypothetical protein
MSAYMDPDQLQSVDPQEQALESQALVSQEPDFSTAGAPPLAPVPPTTSAPPAVTPAPQAPAPLGMKQPQSFGALAQQDTAAANKATQDHVAANNALAKNADDQASLEAWKAEQLQPIYDQMAGRAKSHSEVMQGVQNFLIGSGQKFMKDHEKLVTEASKSVIDPDEVWGGSDGRKVMGAIALALGTFANANSGGRVPNTALQIIQGAIKDSIGRQKFAAQQKWNQVGQHQNMYSMMRQQVGDEMTVEAAMYSTYAEQAAKMVDRLSNSFKTPESRVAAEKTKELLAKDSSDFLAQQFDKYHDNIKDTLMGQLQSYMVSLKAAGGQPEQTQLRGLVGGQGDKGIQRAQSEAWGATTSAAEMLDNAVKRLQSGDMSVKEFRELTAEGSVIHAALRDALKMGKRLEGSEGKDMTALTPGWLDAILADVKGDPTATIAKIEAGRDALLSFGIRNLLSTNKNLQLDPNDPLIGEYLKRKVQADKLKGAKSKLQPKAD